MYYDDEARRFNFLSGLVLGAVLGTGLALLAVPQKALRRPTFRKTAARMTRNAGRAFDRVRDGAARWAQG